MAPVTKAVAREALDNMDDYARMQVGVDAIGPRAALERFIEQAPERAPHTAEQVNELLKALGQAHDLQAYRQRITEMLAGYAGTLVAQPAS